VNRAKRLNGNQLTYIKKLIEQVGQERAQAIGKRVLEDPVGGFGIDILEPITGRYDWERLTRLDRLDSHQASLLIDALLDVAGRKGRRKNNRKALR
jgi:hypothetical protein